ncbi:MAG: YeeE/YedE family protein [Candidatus Thorarchaeota archaeon]
MAFDLAIASTGILVGLMFGYALQRGRLCFNSTIRDPLIFKEYNLLKALFLALAVSMIGFAIMGFTNVVTIAPKPTVWAAQIIGGFVFGMGMVLAAACASGVTYKTGEGIMTAFVGLLGLALGGYTAAKGALLGAKDFFWNDPTINLGTLTFGGDYNLALMLILGAIFTFIMMWKFVIPSYKEWKSEDQGSFVDIFFKKGWPWWMTGIIIAAINMIAWVFSFYIGGRNYPLGITAGWIGILDAFLVGDVDAIVSIGWLSWAVIGIMVGAFIGAKSTGEYKMSSPKTGKPILLAFFGGLMLGVGAVFGGGCNIGNLLSGIPQLSVGSWIFSGAVFLGVWFLAYILFKVVDFEIE